MTDKSLFCPYPWISICADTKGTLAPCTISIDRMPGKAFPSLNDFKEITQNSPSLKKLRRDLLDGVKNPNCQHCWKAEESGLTSIRQHAWRFHSYDADWAKTVTGPDGEFTGPLEDFDIRPGNKCNIKCRMCNMMESSAWKSDHEFLVGAPFNPAPYNLKWGEDEVAWENIYEHVNNSLLTTPKIQVVFAGGEPLMEKNHIHFLRRCVEQGAADRITLRYTTNATILPDESIALWKSFRKVLMGVSLDGIGEVNDYIRYPSKWQTIEKNLNRLLEADHILVWAQASVSIYNLYYLPEIYQWANGITQSYLGKATRFEAHSHMVHNPKYLCINILPPKAIEACEEKFNSFGNDLSAGFLKGALDYAKKTSHERSMTDFWDFTTKLDLRRKQDFAEAMPEWHSILKRS